ncbi:MAG: hypothetical protein C0407_13675, partial [Desulfobacca sp.]|nr:hypothetical protein [Desulfobacca sp.]
MTDKVAESFETHDLHLIKFFAKSFKQIEYYGKDHRIAQVALDQLFEVFQITLENQEELVFEVTPSQVILNQKTTDKEDLQAQALAEGIYKKGISGLRIVKGLTRESLGDFLSVLTRDVLPPQGDAFWNLPGLTVWSLILKEKSPEEETKAEDEAALREMVRKMLSPVAPPDLLPAEEVLEWAAQDEKHLVRAMEHQIQEQKPPEGSPDYIGQAKALASLLTGLTKAYQVLCPDKKDAFLEKIALAITEIEDWEHIWFCELDKEATSLFKIFYGLLEPGQCSQVILQIILSLMTKGSRLVTFLKQCEGALTENREIMAKIKGELEKVAQKQLLNFPDLWSMVQSLFLDSEERQFMDDQYLKQLEGFSEMLIPINWEEESLPDDLRRAFGKIHPLEGTEKTVSCLLEFLITSREIQDLIYWIREMEGIVLELSLSGDYRQLSMVFQEVSKALAALPFHHDPSFPEVLSAWDRLCQVDHTEMFLNSFPTAGAEDRSCLVALFPFLSPKTLTNLLRHLQEIKSTSDYQTFLNFLLSGGKRIVPPLLSLLKDKPAPTFILRALQIIVHFQAEEALHLIPDLLSSLSGTEQIQAARTLSGLKVPEIAPILLPFLKKWNDSQRSEMIMDFQQREN